MSPLHLAPEGASPLSLSLSLLRRRACSTDATTALTSISHRLSIPRPKVYEYLVLEFWPVPPPNDDIARWEEPAARGTRGEETARQVRRGVAGRSGGAPDEGNAINGAL